MREHAIASFRKPPERLNCAQAVLHGYQAVTGDTAIPLAGLKPFGGGRAPDGLCGALHAACTVAPQAAPAIQHAFASRAGAIRCRELDAFDCSECVALAAELLQHNQHAAAPDSTSQRQNETPVPKDNAAAMRSPAVPPLSDSTNQ